MGPRMGDMRTYMFVGVICSFPKVVGTVSKICAICSPDVDVWARLQVIIISLAGGGD